MLQIQYIYYFTLQLKFFVPQVQESRLGTQGGNSKGFLAQKFPRNGIWKGYICKLLESYRKLAQPKVFYSLSVLVRVADRYWPKIGPNIGPRQNQIYRFATLYSSTIGRVSEWGLEFLAGPAALGQRDSKWPSIQSPDHRWGIKKRFFPIMSRCTRC